MLILQSGGPTAVGNRCVASAAQSWLSGGTSRRLFGVRGGFRGLRDGDLLDLTGETRWDEIADTPGAILGSSRYRLQSGEVEDAIAMLRRRDLHHLLVIGGNGTMAGASALASTAADSGYELSIVGVPDTIDNDVVGTELCLGYGSCARYTAQTVINVAADVRTLPTPVSVVEVMGRNAGWVAAATACARTNRADAPHLIYLPEQPTSLPEFLESVQRQYDSSGWVVAVVSEGLRDAAGRDVGEGAPAPTSLHHGGAMIGDVGVSLARAVTAELGLRARSEKPGLAARSDPALTSPVDREAAEGVGSFAARYLGSDGEPCMVKISLNHVAASEGESVTLGFRATPLSGRFYDASRAVGAVDTSNTKQPAERVLPPDFLGSLLRDQVRRFSPTHAP